MNYGVYLKTLFDVIDKTDYHFFINHYMKIIRFKHSYKVYEQELDKFAYIVTVLFAMDDIE